MAPVPSNHPSARLHTPSRTYPRPKYRLHLNDLSHEATSAFLTAVDASRLLQDATATVLKFLYGLETSEDEQHPAHAGGASNVTNPRPTISSSSTSAAHTVGPGSPATQGTTSSTMPPPPTNAPVHRSSPHPPIRSVTLLLRAIDPLAYTTGKEIDDEHKEIHFKLDYIKEQRKALLKNEILGVITHEMVHCWQWNAMGSAPGGLIEGIADWVRLNAGLAPPHWQRRKSNDWDAGYETTGFFLDWLERRKCGKGTVQALNAWLRERRYDEEAIWTNVCGTTVQKLWAEYQDSIEDNQTEE